jgi:hypothetical protein
MSYILFPAGRFGELCAAVSWFQPTLADQLASTGIPRLLCLVDTGISAASSVFAPSFRSNDNSSRTSLGCTLRHCRSLHVAFSQAPDIREGFCNYNRRPILRHRNHDRSVGSASVCFACVYLDTAANSDRLDASANAVSEPPRCRLFVSGRDFQIIHCPAASG